MKVAQTELTEAEYRLLTSYAEKHRLSLKEALREATRLLVLSDKVDPSDPIFSLSSIPGSGKKENIARDHDKYLYGDEARSS
ncbi:MAG TPA: hypothetical protein VFE98_04135 [Candidatus Bathyarchaeia archaeon]|nr:hypothetical protein [Candidatus Bathyarchaeia archaeon]